MKSVFVYRYRLIVSVHSNFILHITNEMLLLKIMWRAFVGLR